MKIPKSWKYPGCKGRFYVRGQNNIIQYHYRNERKSLGLPYSIQNRKIAGEKILYYENRNLYVRDNMPKKISEAYYYFENTFNKKKRPKTIINTKLAIRKFITTDYECVETDIIHDCIIYEINNSKLLPRSINSYLRSLKAFFNWCIRNKIMPNENPINTDMFIKIPDKMVDIFTAEELKKIFDYWKNKNKEFYYFIKFLYLTAFRKNEAKDLVWNQIWNNNNFRDEILLPKSKYGNIYETFPLADNLIDIIRKLKSWKKKEGKVFILQDIRHLGRMLDKSMKEMDIPKKTYETAGNGRSFHTFRKTRITYWAVEEQLPIIVLEKLTRDNYQTLRKYYTKLEIKDYKKYI